MARYLKIDLCFALGPLMVVLVAHNTMAQQGSPTASDRANAGAILRGSKTPTSLSFGLIGQKDVAATPFVIGGQEAPQYKYVVGISFSHGAREAICTGTLMSKRLVLTAGHCGCGDNYRITQNLDMNGAKFIRVEGRPLLLDPRACQLSAVRPGYDLALLQLHEDAEVDDDYQAFPQLAFSLIERTRRGASLVVVGYGLTDKLTNGTRMEASVPVFTTDCAQRQYAAAGCAPFFEMILAATSGVGGRRPDTCSGDSGGPVFAMLPVPGRQPKPTLVAVTSRPAPLPQVDTQNHCGGGGIYTVVGRTDVENWLAQNGASGAPRQQ
jgi:secreted trypsin-like serine protease